MQSGQEPPEGGNTSHLRRQLTWNRCWQGMSNTMSSGIYIDSISYIHFAHAAGPPFCSLRTDYLNARQVAPSIAYAFFPGPPTRRRGRRNAGARRLAAQPIPLRRPNHFGPGSWTTRYRLVGESDRRHLSRGPMSAAIEQSWPYTSYPGQPASSISVVPQSKRLHVELPHQGQQAARARGVAGGGVAVAWLMITP